MQRRCVYYEHPQTRAGDYARKVQLVRDDVLPKGECELGFDSEDLKNVGLGSRNIYARDAHVKALDDEHREIYCRDIIVSIGR